MNCPRCNSSRWDWGPPDDDTSSCRDCGLIIRHHVRGGAAMCDKCNEILDVNTLKGCKCDLTETERSVE